MAALETIPGDILMFNHDTYHSAWGGGNRRRMFTMNCRLSRATKPMANALGFVGPPVFASAYAGRL